MGTVVEGWLRACYDVQSATSTVLTLDDYSIQVIEELRWRETIYGQAGVYQSFPRALYRTINDLPRRRKEIPIWPWQEVIQGG